ncbi:hypothetical protein LTR56_016766 [Elasticomyces elasticus]|nr:hypothetical protein LTR56_016766 [Elasticomyces elasticus]
MDILPLPRNISGASDEFPYLCGGQEVQSCRYDRRSWLEYPDRMGWSKEDLYTANSDSQLVRTTKQSFLQSWLFFGLLIDFLGQHVDQELFVESRSGGMVVSWISVQQQLRLWARKVRSSNPQVNAALKKRLDRLSEDARYYVHTICNADARESPLADDVALSILLLASLLELTKASVKSAMPNPIRIQAQAPQALLATLSAQNWCPSDIYRMRSTLGSLWATYYLNLIGPNDPDMQHQGCDDRRCGAFAVSEAYQHRHVAGCCCHNMMHADTEYTSTLILGNVIPLTVARTPGVGRSRLETIACPKNGVPFIAISHVWSQGLGNPAGNYLPRCQVDTIQQWCNELLVKQDVPFWMDTLCIPRVDPAKRNAIASMSEVYGAAAAVLVIDTGLLDIPMSASDTELIARIYSCGWLRRVWTLQEGVKARRLYFRVRDGFQNLEDLAQRISTRLRGNVDFDPSNQLAWEFLRPLVAFNGITSDNLGDALASIQFRDTTNAGDELVCIKGILGWAEEPVVRTAISGNPSTHNDQRTMDSLSSVQKFLLERPSLPADILFFGGRKMDTPGWRWAPATLADQGAFLLQGPRTSRATTQGLCGSYYGVQVNTVSSGTLQSRFMLHDQTSNIWLVVLDTHDIDVGRTSMQNLKGMQVQHRPSWIDGCHRPAILFQHRLPRAGGTASTVGVVVDVESERDGVKQAQFCGSVAVSLLPAETVQQFDHMKALVGGVQGLVGNMQNCVRLGSAVNDGQLWCIS